MIELLSTNMGKTYGRTRSGVLLTDELIEKLSTEAEEGYDVD